MISVIALVISLTGTGIAQDAVTAVLNKKEKKQTRKIAKKEINKLAPGLTVANAGNASKLAGKEILFANVSSGGTLDAGSPGISSARLGTGIYNVIFPKALAATCSIVGSPQQASQIQVDEAAGSSGDAQVGVVTFTGGGATTDSRFNLIAYC